jgi:hypothetical protein
MQRQLPYDLVQQRGGLGLRGCPLCHHSGRSVADDNARSLDVTDRDW